MIRTGGDRYFQILQAAEEGGPLSSEKLGILLSAQGDQEEGALWQAADRVRRKWVGDEIHLRGIVEFSNHCVQNCLYCGLRRDNGQLKRYRMAEEEILAAVAEVRAKGLKTVVLQSGEDPWFTRGRVSDLVRRVKEETGLAITLSLGERPWGDYQEWRRAGADRYLLKQETGSAALFARLRPGRTLKERLECLRALKEIGYEAGSGNMVGLPGQKGEDLLSDLELFRGMDFDMIGISPFLPSPWTPLAKAERGAMGLTLKVLALTRILTRDTHLPATTAAGVLDPGGRRKALLAGANVVMPDFTPWRYRAHYAIYPGKNQPDQGLVPILELISSLGRKVSPEPGFRPSNRFPPPIPPG